MNPEEREHYENVIKSEIEKRMQGEKESNPFRNEAYSLAGGVAGAGLGLASINAIDTTREQLALRQAERNNINREALQKLKDIYDGRVGWETVNPAAQPGLKEMYIQNQELLKDDSAFRSMMDTLGPKKLHRIYPETKGQVMKRMLPTGAVLDNLGQSLKHPAVSAGALAGMTGGYYLSKMTDK